MLSDSRLKERSRLNVISPAVGYDYFAGDDDNVTIYEGDWGDPYPVRFELFYQPDDGQGEILLTKKYLIEAGCTDLNDHLCGSPNL